VLSTIRLSGNSTRAPSADRTAKTPRYKGDYWSWFKKTYDGLMKRCNGDVKLVAEQMHYYECITFDHVFGIHNFSDEFVKNFKLNSNRPLCKRKIDLVKKGNVTLAVNVTIAPSPTVNMTIPQTSTRTVASRMGTVAPVTKTVAVVEAPKNKAAFTAEAVAFAPKEVIEQVVESYVPPKAGDKFPFIFAAQMPMPAIGPKPTPRATKGYPSNSIGQDAINSIGQDATNSFGQDATNSIGQDATYHPRCG
jgi:hypothetical protein